MKAAEIASALGDEHHDGREAKCRCPLCGGRLALRDSERGLRAWCFGGCEARAVYAGLRRFSYAPADRSLSSSPQPLPSSTQMPEVPSNKPVP